jgi:hypothetical protein
VLSWKYKLSLLTFLIIVSLVLAACGGRNAASDRDIQPVGSIQAEAVAAAKPSATPASLPQELVEPISPLSPLPFPVEAVLTQTQKISQTLPHSDKPLAAAIDHLSKSLNLPVANIQLVSIEAIKWSDSSLGCPQEGYMYAQVITPGFLIMLEAKGQTYQYHTDQAANVVQCQP